uniref:Protein Ycf2 n=1 Tax=Psilotum nudum TaxID=3240 RepID=YCF2_PSINU|nr:Ycf2 [Psilotum nudum]Q8WHW9.1 RecName: Full=Protein Ycf2 [Psilotum nudum]BAB84296.1 hypothetical protein [Psilotum nudum]
MNKELIQINLPANIQNFKEIDLSLYYLRFWYKLNIRKTIVRIWTNRNNLIKLFDFQILSSFILRNLHSSRSQKKIFPLKYLFIITIPLFLYRINSRTLLQRENLVLTKLVNTTVRSSGVIQGISRESYTDLCYLPARVRKLPVCNTTNCTDIEWWKDWIVKDILPSWKISQRLINEVEMLLREKNISNLRHFFELYTFIFANHSSLAWRYDFNSFFVRKQNDRMNCDLGQQSDFLEKNHFFSSVMIAFCEKILFEAEDLSNKQEYKSNLDLIHSRFWIYTNQYHYMNLSQPLIVHYIRHLKDFRVREIFLNLFEDFVEFYSWAYYSANFSTWQRYEEKLGIIKDLVRQALISSDTVSSFDNTTAIQSLFAEILSQFSVYLLSRVQTSGQLTGLRIEKLRNMDLKMSKRDLFQNIGIITKNEDPKVFVSESSISNFTNDSYWSLNYYKYYLFNKWNWKQLLVPVESKMNIRYQTMGYPFSDTNYSIEYEKAYEAIGETAKSFIETLSPRDKRTLVNRNSKSISLSIVKPFHSNLWNKDMLPLHEHSLSVKSISEKIKLLEKQQYIDLRDDNFSDIFQIVDIWGRSRHYHSSRYCEVDNFLLRKRIGRAKSHVHELSSLISSIVNLPSSIFERAIKLCSSHQYLQFKILLLPRLNKIYLLLTKPNLGFVEIIKNDHCNNEEPDSVEDETILVKNTSINNIESFTKPNEMTDVEFDSTTNLLTKENIDYVQDTIKNDLFLMWNNMKDIMNISPISFLIKIDKHNDLTSLCSQYIVYIYQYVFIKSGGYLSKLRSQIKPWVNNDYFCCLMKQTIDRDLPNWENSLNRLNELIIQIDQIYVNVHNNLSIIEDWEDWDYFSNYVYLDPIYEKLNFFFNRLIGNILFEDKKAIKYYSKSLLLTDEVISNTLETLETFLPHLKYIKNFLFNHSSILEQFWHNRSDISRDLGSQVSNKLVLLLAHSKIPSNSIFSNIAKNGNILIEDLAYREIDKQNNWFNCFNARNRIPLKHSFDEKNAIFFLEHFANPQLNYNERLYFPKRKIFIKGYNRAYADIIINDLPRLINGFRSFIRRKGFCLEGTNFFQIKSHLFNKIPNKEYPHSILTQTIQILHRFYLIKEFGSSIQLKSLSTEQVNLFDLQERFLNSSSIRKQLVNIGVSDYWQPLLDSDPTNDFHLMNISTKDQLNQNGGSGSIIDEKSYHNDYLYSKFFGNLEEYDMLFRLKIPELSIHFIPDDSKIESLEKHIEFNQDIKNIYVDKNIFRSNLLMRFNERLRVINILELLRVSTIAKKWLFFHEYIPWFFTIEWWKYINSAVPNTFSETLLNISDQWISNLYYITNNIKNSITYLWVNLEFKLKAYSFDNKIYRFDSSIGVIYKEGCSSLRWSPLRLMSDSNVLYLTLIIPLLFSYIVFQHYLSIFTGFHSFSLWKRFEVFNYFLDPFNKIYIEKVLSFFPPARQKSIKPSLVDYLKRFFIYLTYGSSKRKVDVLLSYGKSLDIFREENNLVVHYLITNRILSQDGFHFHLNSNNMLNSNIKEFSSKLGLNYLQYLANIYKTNLSNFPISQLDLVERCLFFTFWQNIISPGIPGQFHILQNTPIPLQLGSSFPSKGILLIGSMETGRSYLIKSLAANYCLPLIQIPINKLLDKKVHFESKSVVLFPGESVRRLTLTFELVKRMSPCIVWIQDIHELNLDRVMNELEVDPKYLFCSLLKCLSNNSSNYYVRNNIIIAPTHIPSKVDPSFISPNRLDQLINIRRLNIHQREREFLALLRVKGFYYKGDLSHLGELGSITRGYSKRDLTVLANGVLLLSITQKESFVCQNSMELALHRQVRALDNKSKNGLRYEMLFYRIGKAIIQNSLINMPYIDSLSINPKLLRKRFSFLSNWYLETSLAESTVKELTLLPYIMGCLAGIAARDSWFILERKQESLVTLDRISENDIQLAFGILESLLADFSGLEICGKNDHNSLLQQTNKQYFNRIQKVLFSENDETILKENTKSINPYLSGANRYFFLARSSCLSRISFLRSSIYESMELSSESNTSYKMKESNENLVQHTERDLDSTKKDQDQILKGKDEFAGYRRILRDYRERPIYTTLENQLDHLDQLDNASLLDPFLKSNMDKSFMQYEMQYYPSDKLVLFLGRRFIWNMAGSSFIRDNAAFQRNKLFAEGDEVKRLYIAYGAIKERRKRLSFNKYIKKIDSQESSQNLITKQEKRHFENVRTNQMIKSYFGIPRLLPTVYLYQSIFIENTQDRYNHLNLLNYRHSLSSSREGLIYMILLESYHYLLNLFLSNRIILEKMAIILLKNTLISSKEVEQILSKLK